jgi:CYTH domain-containing protein
MRHRVPDNGLIWEVDVYRGAAEGLVTGEVELIAAHQQVSLPSWIGRDITQDPFFSNWAIALRARARLRR